MRTDPQDSSPALQALIARLEAQVRSLTSQLAEKRNSEVRDSGQSDALAHQAADSPPPSSCSCQDNVRNFDIAYTGRVLRPTFTHPNHLGDTLWSSPWQLWGEDTRIEVSPHQGAPNPSPPPMDSYAPALIDRFFACRWPQLPILHRGVFMQRHYAPLSAGLPAEPLSSFQVHMVLAIACADTNPSDKCFSHCDFFQIAIRDLHLVFDAGDLDCIQCLLLLCLYGNSEPQSVNMWHTIGLALRLAMGIDLHRLEAVAYKHIFEAEMSKRLFWSIYILDRSISISMGRPLGILDADITIPLPSRLTDEQILNHEGVCFADNSTAQTSTAQISDTSTFIHIIKLRRINANTYQTFHVAGNRDLDEAASGVLRASYYNQLNEWLVGAPRYLPSASMFQTPEWFQIA